MIAVMGELPSPPFIITWTICSFQISIFVWAHCTRLVARWPGQVWQWPGSPFPRKQINWSGSNCEVVPNQLKWFQAESGTSSLGKHEPIWDEHHQNSRVSATSKCIFYELQFILFTPISLFPTLDRHSQPEQERVPFLDGEPKIVSALSNRIAKTASIMGDIYERASLV